ncbi:MBOAT family O-acyltransferase [Aureimonas mangrovi]|uniref:MBOAT family O-acyltransferase n=1 Tax=Aureimonas mangrovi TaxID=2758041 RepID=UPI00163D97A6|nr:MBOAT family protein [Aureimonas mangrovi]
MLFQTQGFLLLFLPVFLACYYAAARHTGLRVAVLVTGSLVFYGFWDARFVPLLLGQMLGTWLCAALFFRTRLRAILWIGIAANLAVLAAFKYVDFLVGTVEAISGLDLPRAGWLLPIGISFFTFEMVSYLADLLRGHEVRYRLSRFSLFILFFPRLIAGPIVRHNEIVWQFELDPVRPGLAERFGKGFVLLTIGLAKKVLIADPLATLADPVFAQASGAAPSLIDAWAGTLAFTLQLYFDFSAYSDMAIGLALMMGLALPVNFDAPYRAASLRDFWRRWHMTLSRYIRDYLYIPLGGSRHGMGTFVTATMVSMTICGLWHGAGWTFVLWGALHGAGLVANRAWQGAGARLPVVLAWPVTMLFVMAGWVLFRAPDFGTAASLYAGLAGAGGPGAPIVEATSQTVLWTLLAGAIVALAGPTSQVYVERFLIPWSVVALGWALAFVYCVLAIGGQNPVSFIYFQF